MCLGCNAQRVPLDISEASQLCEEASQTQSMMRHLVFDDSSLERQSIENKEQQFCDGEQVALIEETTKACINTCCGLGSTQLTGRRLDGLQRPSR